MSKYNIVIRLFLLFKICKNIYCLQSIKKQIQTLQYHQLCSYREVFNSEKNKNEIHKQDYHKLKRMNNISKIKLQMNNKEQWKNEGTNKIIARYRYLSNSSSWNASVITYSANICRPFCFAHSYPSKYPVIVVRGVLSWSRYASIIPMFAGL